VLDKAPEDTASKSKLYYIHDPMCAWCWGYQPTLIKLAHSLNKGPLKLDLIRILGGLAPDTDSPMPNSMREQIMSYWQHIHNKLGTEFNFDFWTQNTPRRATYAACRAVLVARQFNREQALILAIQKAYYLRALNPSDDHVLATLATEVGLDRDLFLAQLNAQNTQNLLNTEIAFARSIGGNSFPSWVLIKDQQPYTIAVDYDDHINTLSKIHSLLDVS
jgi:putative protein-disulfide isomerase